MVKFESNAIGDERCVHIEIQGSALIVRTELMAVLHNVFDKYALVSGISYDAAKMEMMCSLLKAEKTVNLREHTVDISEDE